MAPNDPLPPPVPSGEPPRVPPPPPALPQFAPTGEMPATQAVPAPPPPVSPVSPPPTQVLPATQVLPPTQPPPMQPPPPSPSGGTRQHLVPWIIGAAVLVVALVLVAVFALRGDDETSGTADTTVAPATTLTASTTPASTIVAPTTAPATVPPSVAPTVAPTTVAPSTTLPGAIVVADDTGVFTVLLLDTFQFDTAPVDFEGVLSAQVTGATNLDAFQSADDHDTFGATILVAPSDQLPPAEDVLASFDPGPAVCADRSTRADYATLNGPAQVLLMEGCGTGGQSAKVVMLLTFADRNLTMVVAAQGPGPANTDLFDFTQAVVESVVFL